MECRAVGMRPRAAALQLSSLSFQHVDDKQNWSSGTPPNPRRCDQTRLLGGVVALIFDFDGTLTATPGDRAERRYKIEELKERAPLLRPWLQRLRDAGIVLGILSKSSDATIRGALEAAELDELFDGPVQGKAMGFEGKAGHIEDMCREEGVFAQLGLEGLAYILLVDDDVQELERAGGYGIQTYAAPEDGGLQEEDFREIFKGLGLPVPPQAPESTQIRRLWTHGLANEALGFAMDNPQVFFEAGEGPLLLDHYDVLFDGEPLGKGSFGIIRPGVHKKSGRRCAIKCIRKDVAGRHYLENFVDKDMYSFLLKMSQQDPHPNVVRQLDYLMGEKVIFNPQELLEGSDLLMYLQEYAPITEKLAARITFQVLSAVRHLHGVFQTGLIHRDVKLENLRFRQPCPRSDLVLVDFGLSCEARPEEKRSIVGTWMYMAPEVFSQQYDEKVDIWSAGVVLYIILTGKPPWVQDPGKGLEPHEGLMGGSAVEGALEEPEAKAAPFMAIDFLRGVLVPADQRPSAASALQHTWLANMDKSDTEDETLCDVRDVQNVSLLRPHKEAYAMTREQSLITPKSMRVGLTWAGADEQDGPITPRIPRSLPITPRLPLWSPSYQPPPWSSEGRVNGGDSCGLGPMLPLGSPIPEAGSAEYATPRAADYLEGLLIQPDLYYSGITVSASVVTGVPEFDELPLEDRPASPQQQAPTLECVGDARVPGVSLYLDTNEDREDCSGRQLLMSTEVKHPNCTTSDTCCSGILSLRRLFQ